MKKNLVVIRAGDKSLHPQWIHPDRTYDIAVSYYGNYPERYKDQYDHLHLFKGSKWQGLSDYLQVHGDEIAKYEYVWFPDDDLFADYKTINNFFHICNLLDLTIAQPALTEYSFYSWKITLRDIKLAARITDFVEIMAPCFKVKTFDHFAPTFSENSSGWGIEWLWKKIAIENQIFKFGVVDMAPVFHTREVGSMGHGGGTSAPQQEISDLLQKYSLQMTKPKTLRKVKINELK